MVKRREFLAGLGALVAAGCTPSEEPLPTTSSAPPTTPAPATTSTAASLPTFQPLAAPAVELTSDPFNLGVASGDPDSESVVLWTRLTGELPAEVPLVWEMGTPGSDFLAVVASGTVAATELDAHSVHVIVAGLPAGARFDYRFRAGDYASVVGHTNTMANSSELVTIGVSSCQMREAGFWQAHGDIADASLDLMVWLGDYTYRSEDFVADLEGYRQLYTDYRTDPLLQRAHASCPWFVGMDDNDVANDYTANTRADSAQRQAAYQAWWENQPTRLAKPTGPELTVYRNLDLGRLARIVLFDVRQYSDPDTGDLLGDAQRQWAERMSDKQHDWTIFASPVIVSELSQSDPDLVPYAWPAFRNDFEWLQARFAEVRAPLVISGDLHAGMSATITDAQGEELTPELMAPAISSQMPTEVKAVAQFLPILNPNINHIDPSQGWLKLEIAADSVTATFRTTDATVEGAPVVATQTLMLDA